jgi:hypothetical protein
MREGRTILGTNSKLLYNETALSRKPFGIGHMYIYTFLLRMTDTETSSFLLGQSVYETFVSLSRYSDQLLPQVPGFIPGRLKKFLSAPMHSDRLWGPPAPYTIDTGGLFPLGIVAGT